jgi:hypothetical protein
VIEIGPNLLAAILAIVSLAGTAVAIWRAQQVALALERHTDAMLALARRVTTVENDVDVDKKGGT